MRKLILYSPIFFIYLFTALICNCHLFVEANEQEVLQITLPQWPPEDSRKADYPELSRWKIQIASTKENKVFYIKENLLFLTVEKNLPVCLLATPITVLENGKETCYFKPAGILYPYSSQQNNQISATWNQGFPANLMYRIICSKQETGISNKLLENFLCSFNWKKIIETLETKISQSTESENNPIFNPWLIDSSKLLDNLCYGNFKATFLNITNCYSYTWNYLFPDADFQPLSSFVTENSYISCDRLLQLKKEESNFFADGKQIGVHFLCKSAKNLSREFIYMPIYIEGI